MGDSTSSRSSTAVNRRYSCPPQTEEEEKLKNPSHSIPTVTFVAVTIFTGVIDDHADGNPRTTSLLD